MERNMFFEKRPQVMPWGEEVIVPLNVRETQGGFLADLVYGVKKPISAESVMKAALDSAFTADEQRQLLTGMASSELRDRYNEFMNYCKEAVKDYE